jgi:DNA-binding winged helix-turn-helix (wHTH) protein
MKVDAMIYTFNRFECDIRDATLRRDGLALETEPDVFRLVAYLLEHRDRVVAKTELRDNLWPDQTVSLDGVTRYVRAARRALGDDGYRQEIIETVRGEGYRFIAQAEEQAASEPVTGIASAPLREASEATVDKMPSDSVSRSITLPLQYYQAGLGILTYVGTILRQRHPDISIKVQIEQDQRMVRLTVEAPDAMRATIERDLEIYGLVVAGKMAPEALLPNPMEMQALRDKLDLMQSELRMTREHLLALQRSGQHQQERITSLGTDVDELRRLMAQALGHGG